jgi:hypothetical protein
LIRTDSGPGAPEPVQGVRTEPRPSAHATSGGMGPLPRLRLSTGTTGSLLKETLRRKGVSETRVRGDQEGLHRLPEPGCRVDETPSVGKASTRATRRACVQRGRRAWPNGASLRARDRGSRVP